MIETRDLSFEVRGTRILQKVSIKIATGSFTAVTGPSGAGKTTLASIIGALQTPSSGSYRFEGREMTCLSNGQLAEFRSRCLGFVFQNSHLIEERSALANVELGVTAWEPDKGTRAARSAAALDRVGLQEVKTRRAADLSGGERHRVALARALVKSPAVLIADEPTAALDRANGQLVLDMLRGVADSGVTVIVVSHDDRAEAAADATIRLLDGCLA